MSTLLFIFFEKIIRGVFRAGKDPGGSETTGLFRNAPGGSETAGIARKRKCSAEAIFFRGTLYPYCLCAGSHFIPAEKSVQI